MCRAKVWLVTPVATAAILSCSALAQETTSYSYEGLGQLQGSMIVDGINNGRKSDTCFDAAGNRTGDDVATSAAAACPISTPTPI